MMTKKNSGSARSKSGDSLATQAVSKKSLFSIFQKDVCWNDKDEVLDAVYWFRQVLAILMGLVWGFLGLTGIASIALFVILNSIAAYGLANNTGYDFDPDENLLSIKEGFMTTFATFLVTWIATYSSVHF